MVVRWRSLVFALVLGLAINVLGSEPRTHPAVDLGWIRAIQEENGWLVAYSYQVPRNGRSLQASDLILSIDGRDLAALNPVSVAFLVETAARDAKSCVVVRNGKRERLDFEFPDHLLRDAYPLHSFSSVRLYERNEVLPSLELRDVDGTPHFVKFDQQWTLLRIGSFGCGIDDLAALDELAASPDLRVIAVSEFDEPVTVRKLMAENSYHFSVLLAGGRSLGDEFENSFSLQILPTPGSGTYVLVAPDGHVAFVSYSTSNDALKSVRAEYKLHRAN